MITNMVSIGERAPDFNVSDIYGKPVKLLVGKKKSSRLPEIHRMSLLSKGHYEAAFQIKKP